MRRILAPFGMAILFILTQIVAVMVVKPFKDAGMEAFENPSDPMNIVQIIVVILVFTFLILLIAKYREEMVRYIILFFFFMASISIFQAFFYFLVPSLSLILSIAISIVMLFLLIKYPEWYVVDFFGIFLAGGIAAIFAISLAIPYIIILLILLALYDIISVHKTRHMVKLAENIVASRLPLLMVIPRKASFSYLKGEFGQGERDAVYMGLGDMIMPGVLIAASYMEYGISGFLATLGGALIGYVALMLLISRGPQPGLPYLNGGAIAAYLLIHFL